MISTIFLLAMAGDAMYGDMILMAIFAAAFAGGSSAWLSASGVKGLWNTRPLTPPARHRAVPRGKDDGRSVERQLLEVIERYGEVTPTKAALETYLTVDEAENKLSELAERGHLDVRAEGGKLVYAL